MQYASFGTLLLHIVKVAVLNAHLFFSHNSAQLKLNLTVSVFHAGNV